MAYEIGFMAFFLGGTGMRKLMFRLCIMVEVAILAADWGLGAEKTAKAESPYMMPFYTGRIYPTPQKATYEDTFYPLDDVGVLIGDSVKNPDALLDILTGRIMLYGGKCKVADKVSGNFGTLIVLADQEGAKLLPAGTPVADRPQAYTIRMGRKGRRNVIVLESSDHQGLVWAVSSLNQLVRVKDGKTVLRKATVWDYPEILNRGYIGNWRNLNKGPKDSLYYNLYFKFNKICMLRDWREKSKPGGFRLKAKSRSFMSYIRKMGKYLNPLGIEWSIGMRPIMGKPENKIRSKNEDDFQILLQYARFVEKCGGHFCLLYDDHRFPIHPDDVKEFGSAREADVFMINRLMKALKKDYPDAKIVFCPPFYWGPTSGHGFPESRNAYLQALGKRLHKDVEIFWTGPRVKSSVVTKENVAWITGHIQRKPVFFQNAFGAPHVEGYHYVTDPITAWGEWHYDGFFEDVDTYMVKAKMPHCAVAMGTLADYCWNPKAYDAETSVREAAMKLTGSESYEALEDVNKCLSYFDMYGLQITPAAAKNMDEINRKEKELDAAIEKTMAHHPAAVRKWTHDFKRKIENFCRKLRNNKTLAKFAKDADKVKQMAVKEVGRNGKNDVFLLSHDFVGGKGPKKYGYRGKEKRLATWIYGAKSGNPRMQSKFRVEPFPPSGDYQLIICGQDDDAEAKCKIRISVNGKAIFEGENPFERFKWKLHTFVLPAEKLKRHNTILIENIEDTSRFGGPPFFLLNYAVLRNKTAN